MKQIYIFTALVIMTMTIFTSCEPLEDWEDRAEARTLDGTWTGYIDTYYYDRWGLTGNSYRTTMYFERETPYSGWGYEVSYNDNSRYTDYYYCEFKWEVYRGTVRISYADSWNDVFINEYHLSNDHFEGYMDDGTSKDIVFDLAYDYRFDWSYWRGYTTRSAEPGAAEQGSAVVASGEFAKKN